LCNTKAIIQKVKIFVSNFLKIMLSQIEEFKKDVENKVRVCEILKKYKITKPIYYRYRDNYGV